MKAIYKHFYLTLCTVLAFAMGACTEEVDYTPAEVPNGAQVYFPNTLPTQMDLDKTATSFNVQVSRATTDAATVNLSVTDESGLFTIPTSVSFAAGEKVANLTISYNPDELEYDDYKSITIAVADEGNKTPYGTSSYKFKAGIPAPWTDWTLFNTGTYTFTGYYSGTHSGRECYIRTYKLDENIKQFRFDGLASAYSYVVDYDATTGKCTVSPQYLFDVETYGALNIASSHIYWHDLRGDETATEEELGASTFNPETGLFSLNVAYYVSAGYFGYGYEYFQLDGYTQPDYALNLSNVGHYVDPAGVDHAVVHIFKGEDLASYKCILKEGALGAADIEAAVAGLVDGSISTDTLYATGYKAFPLEAEGKYTAIAVGFDENDEVQNTASLTFEFMPVGMDDPWKSLGVCAYTEDCMTTFFKLENLTYGVEIREHESKPGLYRLVNAYGAAYPYNEEGDYDTSKEYYIEINAQDPTAVYITNSPTGMNWGYGEISIWSYADYYMANGYTLADVKESGMCGTLVDGVITFPAKTLLVNMAEYDNGGFYTANANGAFKVDMTNLQPAATAMSARSVASPSRVVKEQNATSFKAASKNYMKGINLDGKVFVNQRNQTVK